MRTWCALGGERKSVWLGCRKQVCAAVRQRPDDAALICHIVNFRLCFGMYPKVTGRLIEI